MQLYVSTASVFVPPQVKRRNQRRQQQHRGQLHRQQVGAEQRDAYFARADHAIADLRPAAAQRMQREKGVDVEVIDLRSLSPYDWEAIATSVRKTSKVIVAHEDMLSWGYGAEIAARIGDELFHDLDAPVRRVGAMDTFVAYQPLLEDVILPQPEKLFAAMSDLAAF